MQEIQRAYSSAVWRAREVLTSTRRELLYRSNRHLSDFELLLKTDRYLANSLSAQGFVDLKKRLNTPDATVVDIASARTVTHGTIFLDASHTICVDPAYAWYEYHQMDLWESLPYPSEIFGGYYEKQEMVKLLKLAFKNLELPSRIEGQGPHIIKGKRFHRERTIELNPVDAIEWTSQQHEESIPNIIVWRAFFHPQTWAELLTKLKTGGFLITTGFGRTATEYDYGSVVSGVNIDNSALPRNGNTDALGLIALTDLPEIYFYQKVEHKRVDTLRSALEENK